MKKYPLKYEWFVFLVYESNLFSFYANKKIYVYDVFFFCILIALDYLNPVISLIVQILNDISVYIDLTKKVHCTFAR